MEEMNAIYRPEISQADDNITDVAFPYYLIPTFHHLQHLTIDGYDHVEVIFEIESCRDLATTRNDQQPQLLPYLQSLSLLDMDKMNYVWKCNWNHFLYSKMQRESSFQNLRNISLLNCKNIKYLFSPLMIKLLSNLEEVDIQRCDGIEEVVSNRDDENEEMATSSSSHSDTTFLPHFDTLNIYNLSQLTLIDGGCARVRRNEITSGIIPNTYSADNHFKVDVVSWSLCEHSRTIHIIECNALRTVIPFHPIRKLRKLEDLTISQCQSMREIFETDGFNNSGGDGCGDTHTVVTISRPVDMTLLELRNLKNMLIDNCDLLEHIFISSTLESLKQLTHLTVKECKAMQVIVKEDRERAASNIVVFHRLKSFTLSDLPNVKGFFLGMSEFQWPILDEVTIFGCPQMMIFTAGHSTTPKLSYIHTGIGKHSLECGLNFQLTNASHETQILRSSMCSMTNLLQFPCSFSNLVEVATNWDSKLLTSVLFPFDELVKLQNLEKIHVTGHYLSSTVEIFEVVERKNDDVNEKQVVVFPKLKEVILETLMSVRHIWKSNRLTVLNFPNLTNVLIKQCSLLEHVFTSCMVGSLSQLQELQVIECRSMEAIIKEVEDHDTTATDYVVFRCLKSIKLDSLQNLKGFCLGREAFQWPSLDTLEIKNCPQITVFTCGQSTTPELKVINTTFGLCYATEDPNSFIKTKQQEGLQF